VVMLNRDRKGAGREGRKTEFGAENSQAHLGGYTFCKMYATSVGAIFLAIESR
jgi:hypothetical protein